MRFTFKLDPRVRHHSSGSGSGGLDQTVARGGEAIKEKACVPNPPTVICTFTDWPGLLGWKTGFYYFKNAFEQQSGEEWPTTAQEDACETTVGCRRRFDPNRKHIFHFGLIAHSTSLVNPATPGVPSKSSGAGDKPGGDWQMTVGAWGHAIADFVGSTTFTPARSFTRWDTTFGSATGEMRLPASSRTAIPII